MCKKIFIILVLISSINFVSSQTNAAEIVLIDAMNPAQRAQYLDSPNNGWNSGTGDWTKELFSGNSLQTYKYLKFLNDADGDQLGDPNNYIATRYINYVPLSDRPYQYYRTNGEYTVFTIQIYDSKDNSFSHSSNYFLGYLNYTGRIYIRPETPGFLYKNISYNMMTWLSDCNDSDPNLPSRFEFRYRDDDNDGYGSNRRKIVPAGCGVISGYVTNDDDCNDNDMSINIQPVNWYRDFDEDGYGDISSVVLECHQPDGYVSNSDDCNDSNPKYNVEQITWYADFDGDGFGDPNDTQIAPCPLSNYITNCYFDDCPTEAGTRTNGCPLIEYDFDNENKNYVYDRVYLQPFEQEQLANTTNADVLASIAYIDGHSRLKQQIGIGTTPLENDMIQHTEYDGDGQQSKTFLPYVSTNSNGDFDENSLLNTLDYYNTDAYENTQNPYSETHFEASPLNRVLEQGAPGADWAVDKESDTDHTIKFEYQTNTESDMVRLFKVDFEANNTEAPKLQDAGLYDPNELYKTITKDENWKPDTNWNNDGNNNTSEEYKNKQGQVILKRTFNNSKWHDTYYVYDDFGNLTYVLPPKLNTYASLWQQEQLPRVRVSNLESLYHPDYTPQSSSNYFGYSFFALQQRMYFYSGIYSDAQVPLNTETMVFDLGLDFDIPNGPIPGSIRITTSANSHNWEADHYTAYIQDGKLYISGDGTVVYRLSMSFHIDLGSVSIQAPNITASELNDLAYQYKYDGRNRLIEKKIPGKGWESIVYDKLDRPVMTQDANLKDTNQWLFTKYDVFGRVAYTGIRNIDISRSDLQTLAVGNTYTQFESKTSLHNVGDTQLYYTSAAIPTGVTKVFTINYYDTYEDLTADLIVPTQVLAQTVTTQTKGLPTVSKVRVLDTNHWITTVSYYDAKARPIYIYSKNEFLKTTDITKLELDFTGKTLQTHSTHQKVGETDVVTIENYSYDHAGRLLTQKQTINNQAEELIAENHYDELGQLNSKGVGGEATAASPLQTIDYTYNIRGWLKTINEPENLGNNLFGFELNYNTPQGPSTSTYYNTPLYNGNISHVKWQTNNLSTDVRHYSYKYDAMNRFTQAIYAENQRYNSKYNAYIYNYDRNGNIGRLLRYGENPDDTKKSRVMDYLKYTYDNGNQLTGVKDHYNTTASNSMGGFVDGNTSAVDYAYDANGNMTADQNKKITSIQYNHLNLPTKIEFDFDENPDILYYGSIEYIYDATGLKLQKKVSRVGALTKYGQSSNLYAGNYIYEGFMDYEKLKFFSHAEGYVEPSTTGFEYVYQYKDHLGNIRLSYSDMNKDGVVAPPQGSVVFSDDLENSGGWDSEGANGGWSAPIDTSKGHLDNSSVKLHRTVSGGYYAHSNEWIPINNSEPTVYKFSGWVYLESSGYSWARLVLFMNENEEDSYYTEVNHSARVYTKNQWVYLEQEVTVPVNIDKINLRVDLYNNSPSVTAWFDELRIEKIESSGSEIVEENNYYPFGLRHKGYNNLVSANSNDLAKKFKFNGVELEESLGLNLYEMSFRQYDPTIARFTSIDPVTHFSMSTYTAFDNNPIYWSDPSGADSEDYYGKYDLEWGGYMMDPGDRGYSDEGQNRGYFLGDWDQTTRLDEVVVHASRSFMNEDDQEHFDDEDMEKDEERFDYLQLEAPAHPRTNLEISPLIGGFFKRGFKLLKGFKWGKKLYSNKMLKAFQNQLKNDGRSSVIKSQKKIMENLNQHLIDLKKYKKAGGYTSSVEREIKTFKAQLQAIKDVLKN